MRTPVSIEPTVWTGFASALLLASMLAGCITPQPALNVSAKVDAAVVGLTTAESLARIYTALPSCLVPHKGTLCHDPVIKQKILALDNTAYAAVKAAERDEALLALALAAVTDLQSAIPQITR